MKNAGLPTDGVAQTLPGRSPVCIMAYDPTGASYCLYEATGSRVSRSTAPSSRWSICPTGFAYAPNRRARAGQRSCA